MKKTDSLLKEYVAKLSMDHLKYLSVRLNDRIGSDLAEAAEFLSQNSEVDKFLLTSRTADEFYNMLDMVCSCVDREISRRIPDMVEA
jgi:hypothetical protein